MRYTGVQGSRYAVGGDLHIPSEGDGSTVGGPTKNPEGLQMRNRIRGERQENTAMVEKGEYRGGS